MNDSSRVLCHCNHLTSFAIIMVYYDDILQHNNILFLGFDTAGSSYRPDRLLQHHFISHHVHWDNCLNVLSSSHNRHFPLRQVKDDISSDRQ